MPKTSGVSVKIPEWEWEKIAAIAAALNLNGETLIASMLANALAPFHVVRVSNEEEEGEGEAGVIA